MPSKSEIIANHNNDDNSSPTSSNQSDLNCIQSTTIDDNNKENMAPIDVNNNDDDMSRDYHQIKNNDHIQQNSNVEKNEMVRITIEPASASITSSPQHNKPRSCPMDEIDRNIEEFCKIPGEPELNDDELKEDIHDDDDAAVESLISDNANTHVDIDNYEKTSTNILQMTSADTNNNKALSLDEAPAYTPVSRYNNPEFEKNVSLTKQEILIQKQIQQLAKDYYESLKRKSRWKRFIGTLQRLKWSNIFYLSVLHIAFVYSCYHAAVNPVKVWTVASAVTIGFLSGIGMSVGAHRYWAHRSFKAHTLFRLALMILQTMTMNGTIFSYSRDHRNHHKYSDTEADPKNPARGLFHAHVGWWLWKKTPVVITMGKKFDVSDLWNDKMVWFQYHFYIPLFLFFSVLLPTVVPWLIWNEDLETSFHVMVILRTTVVLHLLFCVNSVAHHFGYRPFDFRIRPGDSRVINYLSLGEGNHNYHHVFPYDYRSTDKASWEYFDPISGVIQVAEWLGLAYDCKRASPEVVMGIVKRKGIPAYFDKKRSLTFRICNAAFDWVCGSLVTLWIIYPFIIYKAYTGQEILIFRFTPYEQS